MNNPTPVILILTTTIALVTTYVDNDDFTPDRHQLLPATETNIKQTMSLVFEPSFQILKEQIGTQSISANVKFGDEQQHSLILSELSARLHDWPEIQKFHSNQEKLRYLKMEKALQIRELQQAAARIYESAKKKNF